MLKNLTQLHYTIDEKSYYFMCDPDSPIKDVKEALLQFINYALNIEMVGNSSQNEKKESPLQDPELSMIVD